MRLLGRSYFFFRCSTLWTTAQCSSNVGFVASRDFLLGIWKRIPKLWLPLQTSFHPCVIIDYLVELHPFHGPLSRTTRVSRYQKGTTHLDFTEARDSEWQWHQLGHMQVCTSLQTDNHASTPPLKFFYRPDALPAARPTASKHWRQQALKATGPLTTRPLKNSNFTNSRWHTSAILKTVKSPYLCNRMTDFD